MQFIDDPSLRMVFGSGMLLFSFNASGVLNFWVFELRLEADLKLVRLAIRPPTSAQGRISFLDEEGLNSSLGLVRKSSAIMSTAPMMSIPSSFSSSTASCVRKQAFDCTFLFMN